MDIIAYIAKESWLKANPELAMSFKRAIDKATMDLVNGTKEERDVDVARWVGEHLAQGLNAAPSLAFVGVQAHPRHPVDGRICGRQHTSGSREHGSRNE